MNLPSSALAACVSLVLFAGCSREAPVDAAPAGGAAVSAAGTGDARTATADADGFDITRVPVSTVALGDFPYITLPEGYSADGRVDKTKKFARFPFWVDGAAQWVEGRYRLLNFDADEEAAYSQLEVRRNIDAVVAQMGGVEVSEGTVPESVIEGWGDAVMVEFNGGIGDIHNEPATTYLIRRDDGNVWIHLVANSSEAWMVVGQEEGFAQTAALRPASELRNALDSTGKVALQVNFATDGTDVLPDSRPQIDQVVKLLTDDPSLQLAIHGHTDNAGDAAHNRTLSEGRAEAVRALLVASGVDTGRLQAQGHGDSQPVADNASDSGRAQNRRVELVKR